MALRSISGRCSFFPWSRIWYFGFFSSVLMIEVQYGYFQFFGGFFRRHGAA
jgi:hypothetical protein